MTRSAPKLARRRRVLLVALVTGSAVVLGRAVELQILEAETWSAKASDQQRERLSVPAPRGTIYDRNGVPLAASREMYRVAVAPREVRDGAAVAGRLREVLGLNARQARRAVDRERRWVVVPGLYDVEARKELEGVHGVHFERVLERFYPHGEVGLALLGRVSSDGRPLGGLEAELDSVLSGRPGETVVRRDARGRPIPGAMMQVREPVPGEDVYLTLDVSLQEIAEEALGQALEETQAAGGDLVVVDPSTGEILAAVSRRRGGYDTWTAVLSPYEPGSTAKPFLVATLLSEGKATMTDSVFGEEGSWTADGRTIRDVERFGWISVHDALEHSSNIAMAKLSGRLDPDVQYRYLRAFGFGTPTGLRYPAESSGLLRRPESWSRYSQASHAIGYEFNVTPLQITMAYGALANGGVLMEPRLVREVRSRDGRVVSRVEPRAVRRVVAPDVAEKVRSALRDVVEGGTGRQASLDNYAVAGKTGTARRFVAGRYAAGAYSASFAGYFPADDPQLVFLVKLDQPQGAYYGGSTAAPVIRATLTAALASRDAPLDRRAVAVEPREPGHAAVALTAADPERAAILTGARGSSAAAGATDAGPGADPFVFALGEAPPDPSTAAAAPRPVPHVEGLPLRDAARRLYVQGFRVRVKGGGSVRSSAPAEGTVMDPGTVVTLVAGASR